MIKPSVATIHDEVLVGDHLATAHGLRIQIHAGQPLHQDALFGDWAVTGVFENQAEYVGLLSELGLQLAPSSGVARMLSLPGLRCLMPDAYKALQALKDQAAAVTLSVKGPGAGKESLKQAQQAMQECQPWTNWIVRAALKKGQVVPITELDEHWLENEFAGLSAMSV
ncbi:hypothetical protein DZC31_30315 (plasmid) [Stenotrophomonas rhizophila]|nr:hypothetical protein DZC31_30315 [Stenotrophomonas rhizophila]